MPTLSDEKSGSSLEARTSLHTSRCYQFYDVQVEEIEFDPEDAEECDDLDDFLLGADKESAPKTLYWDLVRHLLASITLQARVSF